MAKQEPGGRSSDYSTELLENLSARQAPECRAQNRLAGWRGWRGWLAYKVPYAACRKIPCPSAAAQRAVCGTTA